MANHWYGMLHVLTLERSHEQQSAQHPGSAAKQAEDRKNTKYADLQNGYCFTPLGFETTGHWGPTAVTFIQELGRLLKEVTGEPRSTAFLRQRLSIVIQRGNSAAIRGTVPGAAGLRELFNLPFDS